ncbi:MAG: hypothetical protein MRERC_3c003 [Mycoplasmataceae bacterium RC_NB112A]|nr:MAG: hypothetical protein MRERC_9c086 [Mycoplasmataceae bacterium RC_NB112A]KLL02183.1 MAG: hypothetical protein MRERC_3c003 [Mycoplasmataceae bacterium RC_NB112A]
MFWILFSFELCHLLVVGKKHLPTKKEASYFAFMEAIKENKDDLLHSLGEKSYSAATRGERTLPDARCLGAGKFLLVEHRNHTHFVYRLTASQNIKPVQTEFKEINPDSLVAEFAKINPPEAIAPLEE